MKAERRRFDDADLAISSVQALLLALDGRRKPTDAAVQDVLREMSDALRNHLLLSRCVRLSKQQRTR